MHSNQNPRRKLDLSGQRRDAGAVDVLNEHKLPIFGIPNPTSERGAERSTLALVRSTRKILAAFVPAIVINGFYFLVRVK